VSIIHLPTNQLAVLKLNLTILTLAICSLTILEQVCVLVGVVYSFVGRDPLVGNILTLVGDLGVSVKHAGNFYSICRVQQADQSGLD
jgi:hypothetical protein